MQIEDLMMVHPKKSKPLLCPEPDNARFRGVQGEFQAFHDRTYEFIRPLSVLPRFADDHQIVRRTRQFPKPLAMSFPQITVGIPNGASMAFVYSRETRLPLFPLAGPF